MPLAFTTALTDLDEPIASFGIPSSRRKWDQWSSEEQGDGVSVSRHGIWQFTAMQDTYRVDFLDESLALQ